MKKRGFGKDRWNGVGGKVGDKHPETVQEAMIRETEEEISVKVSEFHKVAEITFNWLENPKLDTLVHAFLCTKWDRTPTESEEMAPEWFNINKIPYDSMWPDDKFWLPKILEKLFVKATFSFNENEELVEKNVNIVDSL